MDQRRASPERSRIAQRAIASSSLRPLHWGFGICVALGGASLITVMVGGGRWATTALVILFAGLGAFLVGALLMLRRLLPLQRKVRLGLICGHCGHQLAPGRNASACPECGYHRVQGRFVGDDAPKGD